MKLFAALLTTLCMTLSTPLWAQSNPVVVELFTSQGCSSCPPADALLHKLTGRDDVIPLALHVDYWDYIGWKDEYADPAHTTRQKGYARVAGRKMIYTPQMIVNGQDGLVGAHAMELFDLITEHKAVVQTVAVQARRRDGTVIVQVNAVSAPVDGPLMVYLVRYSPIRAAHITGGENAGHDVDYANVVDGWSELGEWDGAAPIELQATLEGERPAVILVQRQGPGAIVAAARAR